MRLIGRLGALPVLASMAFTAGPAFTDGPDDALGNLMALLAQRRHGVADFTQTQYLAVLKQPQRSEGVLSYDAPDHLEQRTLKPHPQSAVLDHGVLTLTRGLRQRTVSLDEYPQLAPLIDSVRATLAGDLPSLERRFELRLTGDLDHWQIKLTPRESGLALGVQQIRLSGERDRILQVEVQQAGGDHSLMTIKPRE
jgi:outer membrane lipoprotein-sorting protein